MPARRTATSRWTTRPCCGRSAHFLQRLLPPRLIDEVQDAPELMPLIRQSADAQGGKGLYWLTGSQPFHLTRHIAKSLAGRVAVVHLQCPVDEVPLLTPAADAVLAGQVARKRAMARPSRRREAHRVTSVPVPQVDRHRALSVHSQVDARPSIWRPSPAWAPPAPSTAPPQDTPRRSRTAPPSMFSPEWSQTTVRPAPKACPRARPGRLCSAGARPPAPAARPACSCRCPAARRSSPGRVP